MKAETTFNGFGALAIFILFFMLWVQSGWYRIDCALGVVPACKLIEAEYAKKDRP
jgi:hypothetical protein